MWLALALTLALFVPPGGPVSLEHLYDSAPTSAFSGIVRKVWILRSGRIGGSNVS